jgi:hypothetical protein
MVFVPLSLTPIFLTALVFDVLLRIWVGM